MKLLAFLYFYHQIILCTWKIPGQVGFFTYDNSPTKNQNKEITKHEQSLEKD
ncbi:unnamed protein product [Absidia cylindrospora]